MSAINQAICYIISQYNQVVCSAINKNELRKRQQQTKTTREQLFHYFTEFEKSRK